MAEISGNLVTNGDFELGSTGFNSDYSRNYGSGVGGQATGEGQYKIVTQMADAHSGIASGWGNLTGFGGSGYYMFANGSTDVTKSPWKNTLTNPAVTLTTDINTPLYYRFEAQVANANGAGWAQPSLSFEISIDGGAFKTFVYTPQLSVAQQWTTVYADTYFFTSAPSTIALRLRNLATDGSGNDFALDNIYCGLTANAPSFLAGTTTILSVGNITNPTPLSAPIPEPSTYGLALGGLALAWAAARRRKEKTKV